jgi:hypothetical protein
MGDDHCRRWEGAMLDARRWTVHLDCYWVDQTARLRIYSQGTQPQCGRELCALARVNMSGSREPSRSSDDDFPCAVVTSPPTGGSGFV